MPRRARPRPTPLLAVLTLLALGLSAAPASAAVAVDRTELVAGRPGGPCRGAFEVWVHGVQRSCTHPDRPPAGIDPAVRDGLAAAPATAAPATAGTAAATAATAAVPCYGDGSSGNRVQAVYAYVSGQTDRSSQVVPSIRTWAAAADQVFADSAAETGGVRHVRWVTDAGCTLVVSTVAVPAASAADFAQTESALASAGFNRTDRKYLVWTDTNTYCGIADVMLDDRPGQSNASNGGRAEYARVDKGCWGAAGQSVEAHELMHNLGGVQGSAPHSTPAGHCYDESDRMCYADGSGVAMQQVCPISHESLFDCNHDDYFHTAPATGSYLAGHWDTANSSFLATTDPSPPPVAAAGRYTPLSPARVLDTRNGTGGVSGPVGAGQSISVQVTGAGGVPATGVSAVLLNVAVTQPSAGGYLTVYPTGGTVPLASNLNFVAGQTVPNLVLAKVGTGGKVSIYNQSGASHVIADVQGWYSDGSATQPAGGLYAPLSPSRLLDTRNGTGGILGALGGALGLDLQVTGVGGVPSTGVSAVVLNVAVTGPSVGGYLTVYPAGGALPLASNLNFVGGQTVSNMVVAKVGAGGKVSIYNALGVTHVVADVAGWFSDGTGTPPPGGLTTPVTPARILDTRNGTGGITGPVAAAQTVGVQVTGVGGVPSAGVAAVVLNVTVTNPTADGYITVWPAGSPMPLASNLNFGPGQTVPNLVMAKVGAGGKVSVYNSTGTSQLVVDVAGWVS